ncbi:MAG: cytochrome c biogenesis protein CcdA [Chloroflexi bacterium]|nr:cytochrome c biogenesis protein CcdA [Chloroflexota bacterium]
MMEFTGNNTNEKTLTRIRVFFHALTFVASFSLVFIVGWGGATTALGQLFGSYKFVIARIGGVLVILFGLATLDIIRIPWFYYDTRPQFSGRTGTYASSALLGLFFAAGWTPCIGATLGAILTLGVSQNAAGQAMWLASGYSLGLGIPFLLLALGLERATGWMRKLSRFRRAFQIASGVLIISIGVLLVTNWMSLIAIWAFKNKLFIDVFSIGSGVPSYLTAILAGALSFFSPCVMPLVPAYLGYLSGHAIRQEA